MFGEQTYTQNTNYPHIEDTVFGARDIAEAIQEGGEMAIHVSEVITNEST